MSHTALVVGATGIVGQNLAARLVAEGWAVYGLARRPRHDMAPILPVAADLLDPETLRTALADIRPTHVYFCSWMRHATEEENCRVNSALVRNVFAALAEPQRLRHAALTTGMKHYLGPFESYASGVPRKRPSGRKCRVSHCPISIMIRKMPCMRHRRNTGFHGACIGRTRSSVTPSAMR